MDFSSAFPYQTSAVGWYVDARHVVQPLTAGHRLELCYNLVWTSTADIEIPRIPKNTATQELHRVLTKWRNRAYVEGGEQNFLAYILDRRYTAESLSKGIEGLKGRDASKASFLKPLAEELGYTIYFGSLFREIIGEAVKRKDDAKGNDLDQYQYSKGIHSEMVMGTVEKKICHIRTLVDLQGASMLGDSQKLPLDVTDIVQKNLLEDDEPDEKYFGTQYDHDFRGKIGHCKSIAAYFIISSLPDGNHSQIIDAL
jgi:hypothetical protein